MQVDRAVAVAMYRKMALIRRFEERMYELFSQGKIPGTVHPSIGQEAVAVGVCQALRPQDYVASNHRGHGHSLAKGASPERMMAELLGRATGYCQGKGGSMHVADVGQGILGANGIVGAGIPIAVGAGLSARILGEDRVAVVFFGDGGAAAGACHEGMNLAAIWKLPVVFVCENNLYSLSVPFRKVSPVAELSVRASGYAMPGVTVDGMDALAVYAAAQAAVDRARRGGGPSFIEARTYRFTGHSRGDPNYGPYRSREEWEQWRQRDPLRVLAEGAGLGAAEQEAIQAEVHQIIEDAVAFGLNSPPPDVATALTDIYA